MTAVAVFTVTIIITNWRKKVREIKTHEDGELFDSFLNYVLKLLVFSG